MTYRSLYFIFFLYGLFSTAFASPEHIGTLVRKEGKVEVFNNPSRVKPTGPGPHILFEGNYYTYSEAKLGTKMERGNVLRTGVDSKARVVFKNGDQYNIGPNTSYRVDWKLDKYNKGDASVINLMRGKIRGIVSKKGPRNGLVIKTKVAAMGVRGTDFFIHQTGNEGKTKVAVLRGEVSVKHHKDNKKMKVPSGHMAEVIHHEKVIERSAQKEIKMVKKVQPKVELAKITKNDLLDIHHSSVVKKDEKKQQQVHEKVSQEIEKLEKKAIETTLEDIKHHDKKLYASLKGSQESGNVDHLNSHAIKKIFKEAPVSKKPGAHVFDDLGEDAYDRYFKVE